MPKNPKSKTNPNNEVAPWAARALRGDATKAPSITTEAAAAEVVERIHKLLAPSSPVSPDTIVPLVAADANLLHFMEAVCDRMRARAATVDELTRQLAESEKREKAVARDFASYKDGVRDARSVPMPMPMSGAMARLFFERP